ncbi:MFS transporter [Agrobacterium pusense]|uniref:MFS transporter n=1 Tax=Agrobacterium pusense TaxID=648995 RepID=UPI002FE0790B
MQTSQKTLNKVVISSLIGATIEWYEFFVYGILAGIVLNKLFFPSDDPSVSLMLAYATFALGFLARPFGGIVFGHFGDKIGRKSMLVVTLMIMGLSTFAMGLLPTYEQIGLWAPALLLLARMLQGIGLGGEWGGAVLMAYEYAPEDKRGFYTSIPSIGVALGILLSAGTVAILSAVMSDEAFMAWGWRIAFLITVFFILVGMWIRVNLHETPDFSEVKEEETESKLPIAEIFQKYGKNTLLGLGARLMDGIFFNVFAVFSITYLVSHVENVTRGDALVALMIGSAVLIVFTPIAGHLSDKMSRARLYAFGTIISAISVFPAFWGMMHSNGQMWQIVLAIVVPYGILYSAVYGNTAAFLCDLFEPRVRYTGISFVYQVTSVIAGLTPLVATYLIQRGGGTPWLVCGYVLLAGVISATCASIIARNGENASSGYRLARTR